MKLSEFLKILSKIDTDEEDISEVSSDNEQQETSSHNDSLDDIKALREQIFSLTNENKLLKDEKSKFEMTLKEKEGIISNNEQQISALKELTINNNETNKPKLTLKEIIEKGEL